MVGVVGESGSGKSVTMMALMGLIDAPGMVTADEVTFNGKDLLKASARDVARSSARTSRWCSRTRSSSLNPSYTVGYQIKEVLKLHEGLRGDALQPRALELLDQVGIPDAKSRINAFPHQMSGGMNQRVMIAMAVACNPKLLIADEPTTALDVTIQAQIMELLVQLQKERGMALVLISHDLAVVSEVAQRVAVMYAGEIIETNHVPTIFSEPHHPYTEALLAAIPEHSRGAERLAALPGMVPGRDDRPSGCLFAPRCKYAVDDCWKGRPALLQLAPNDPAVRARCIKPLNLQVGRRTWRRAMNAVPQAQDKDIVLAADKLTRHYTVKRSMFTAGHGEGAQRRVVLARTRQDARGGRRIGLRQVDARAPAHDDRSAHFRAAADRRSRTWPAPARRRSPSCASACRWCSRTRLRR